MMRTEEGISGIGPTNEFNVTGVIYHSIQKDIICQFSIRAKTSKERTQLV